MGDGLFLTRKTPSSLFWIFELNAHLALISICFEREKWNFDLSYPGHHCVAWSQARLKALAQALVWVPVRLARRVSEVESENDQSS